MGLPLEQCSLARIVDSGRSSPDEISGAVGERRHKGMGVTRLNFLPRLGRVSPYLYTSRYIRFRTSVLTGEFLLRLAGGLGLPTCFWQG